ncbi:hypothetical protein ACHAPU_001210 [Fusarium lateritium]
MSMYQTTRSGWSEWSDWIYHPDHQQSYRQRVDSSGNTDTQWQVQYEAALNSRTPRTDAHMDQMNQMTQQFETTVNIQSPEQGAGEEQNYDEYAVAGTSSRTKSKSSRSHTGSSKSKSKPSRTSGRKGKGPAQEDINEIDERGQQGYEGQYSQYKSAAPQAEQMYYDPNTRQYYPYSQTGQADPTTSQPYIDGSGDAEDPELQAALAQSKHYTRDSYRGGESSATATYSPYVAQDEDEEPGTAAPLGNPEHIYGTGGETEQLDPRYRVEKSNSFQPGEVFKVLWPEPAGGGGSIVDETVYKDQYGGKIFVHFRRFIVVANDLGHCTCIPISTYGRKGCKKSGVKAEQHGIVAESSNQSPSPLHNEPTLGFPPVRVHIYEPGERISPESRVNYAKLTTVEHNVKVLFIGRVINSDYDIVTHAVNSSWAKKMHTNKKKHRR